MSVTRSLAELRVYVLTVQFTTSSWCSKLVGLLQNWLAHFEASQLAGFEMGTLLSDVLFQNAFWLLSSCSSLTPS